MTAVHVVMTGSDATAFGGTASDTRGRLLLYAEILSRLRPGSELTYLAVGAPRTATPQELDGLRLVPIPGGAASAWPRLHRQLRAEHGRRAIRVVTTQTPDEEAWVALHFARSKAIPVVAQVHYDFFSPALTRNAPTARRTVRSLRRLAARRALTRCAAVRVVGSEVARRLAALPGVPGVHLIPVAPAALPTAASTRRDMVLFVGRLSPEKRLGLWLEVAAQVAAARPETRFEIVGDGPERGALHDAVAQLPFSSRVRMWGALPPDELARRYAEARVLLLTSAHEGFGRVLVEAARSGLPVVSVDIPGPRDIVQDGVTGHLREEDPAKLALAVTQLLEEPGRAGKMGSAARAHVASQFDPNALAERWMSLLVDVAEGAGT